MEIITTILITIVTTYCVLYFGFFSPKAQIKYLYKRIFEHAYEISKYKSVIGCEIVVHKLEGLIRRKGNLVNSLLDNYFDPEEDKDFIDNNRWE